VDEIEAIRAKYGAPHADVQILLAEIDRLKEERDRARAGARGSFQLCHHDVQVLRCKECSPWADELRQQRQTLAVALGRAGRGQCLGRPLCGPGASLHHNDCPVIRRSDSEKEIERLRELLEEATRICDEPGCTAAVVRRDDGTRYCAKGHPSRWVEATELKSAQREIEELNTQLTTKNIEWTSYWKRRAYDAEWTLQEVLGLEEGRPRLREILEALVEGKHLEGGPSMVVRAIAYIRSVEEKPPTPPLTFAAFRNINVRRCEAVFFPLEHWNVLEYAGAAAGELGEAANLAKKIHRGDAAVSRDRLGEELADALVYIDLLAARAGIDLETALIRKFNAVSKHNDVDILLPEPADG